MYTDLDLELLLDDIATYRMRGLSYLEVAAKLGGNVTADGVRTLIRMHRAAYAKAKKRARLELLDELFATSLAVMRDALYQGDLKTRSRAAETLLRIHHQQTKDTKARVRPAKEAPHKTSTSPAPTTETPETAPNDGRDPLSAPLPNDLDNLEPLPPLPPLPNAGPANTASAAHTQYRKRPTPPPAPTEQADSRRPAPGGRSPIDPHPRQ